MTRGTHVAAAGLLWVLLRPFEPLLEGRLSLLHLSLVQVSPPSSHGGRSGAARLPLLGEVGASRTVPAPLPSPH